MGDPMKLWDATHGAWPTKSSLRRLVHGSLGASMLLAFGTLARAADKDTVTWIGAGNQGSSMRMRIVAPADKKPANDQAAASREQEPTTECPLPKSDRTDSAIIP